MNLPNKITTFRMFIVVVILCLLLIPYACNASLPIIGGVNTTIIYLISCGLFIIASFSDYLDGHIARKYNLVTNYGKFMDPIADKLLVDSLFIVLTVIGPFRIPVIVTVIMISRDLLVDALRMLAMEKNKVLAANIFGKIKTVVQMITLIFVLLNDWPFSLIGLPFSVTKVLCYLAALASLISGILYFAMNINVFKEDKK